MREAQLVWSVCDKNSGARNRWKEVDLFKAGLEEEYSGSDMRRWEWLGAEGFAYDSG